MIPTTHPLSKTSIELRRAINRLHIFQEQFPDDPHAVSVGQLIDNLKTARTHIPPELRDTDLKDD